MYINTHTYYSLRYGVMSPRELLELLKNRGIHKFVLTDINTTSACLEFIREAPSYGVEPVVGVDFRNGIQQQFILVAQNNEGFNQINQFLTSVIHNKMDLPLTAPVFKNVYTIYPFRKDQTYQLKNHEFLGISPEDIPIVRMHNIDVSKAVILQPVTFRNKKDFNAHRLLRAIDNNTLLSKLPVSEQAFEHHKILDVSTLQDIYAEYPEVIKNTQALIQDCNIDFDFSDTAAHQNQKNYTGSEEEDFRLLKELCEKGLPYRYVDASEEVLKRIDKELVTIKKMKFISYFLMNWDIVNYARSKGYFYVGRGSGANSIVAYLLRITDVDPIELDLYFERFINLYRTNPPDFDIDFSWTDRDDVTRYIFQRFKHVALVATYNTFSDRGVVRELGKVFGLPKSEIDALSKGTVLNRNHLTDLVLKYSRYIYGFPSHLSVHASGIVISERPISAFTATFMPPKGYPTLQFDMHIAEDIGLFKFDILSQRGLSKIKDTLAIIRTEAPEGEIDIHNIAQLKQDSKIKELLRSAKATGCFYVESPAMRMLLTKLRVDSYLGLVAASSVIRPGVAQSGMMQEYIKRFRNPEKRGEAHPVLLKLMPETFGVMVYQEDVIKVAHHFAGLTLGEADKMRRGMSGKFRSRDEFQAVKEKFFSNCKTIKGHPDDLTREVWRQTESFAGYAFAKGHSASYAVESYQCLFLKAYYPLAFLVATINNYGGFFRTELYVLEAKYLGGIIHPPCINKSKQETILIDKDIFLGFQLLKSFERKIGQRIIGEREARGVFLDFDDFIERVPISLEQITILIRINALRFTNKNKHELLWEAHFKLSKAPSTRHSADLFRVKPQTFSPPKLPSTWQVDAFDQIELLGFSLHSYFHLLRDENEDVIGVPAKELTGYIEKSVWVKGYLIHAKRTTTSDGKHMFFGTFIDQNGEWLDTVHFPIVAQRYPFRGAGIYKIYGKVTIDYDAVLIEVEFMQKMSIIEDPRYSEVRDRQKEKKVVTWNNRKDYGKRVKNNI